MKIAAGAAAAMIAPPGYLFIKEQTSKGMPRSRASDNAPHWAMLIDQSECIGCNRCSYACKAVNDFPGEDVWWNIVYSEGLNPGTAAGTAYLPRPCMMCEETPCVEVCPVGATFKREGDTLVVMDYEKCIGCRYCVVACPYGARYFNWDAPQGENPAIPQFGNGEVARRPRGVVEKCQFCSHRLDAGLAKGLRPGIDIEATPACVVVCPVPARFFGDLRTGKLSHPRFGDRPASSLDKAYRLKAELGTKPRVYYVPPRGKA